MCILSSEILTMVNGTTINLISWAEPEAQRGLAACQIRGLRVAGPGLPPGLTMPTTAGDKSFRQNPGQRLRPRDKTGAHAILLILGALPNQKWVSYRCLEAFEVWGQDWVVDARKFLDAFQDFSMVSHLGAKGDIANSPPRQQRARVEKAFLTQKLCSPWPLDNRGLMQSWVSPRLSLLVWQLMSQKAPWHGWESQFLHMANSIDSTWAAPAAMILPATCWEHAPSPTLGSALYHLTLSWTRIFLPTWLSLWRRSCPSSPFDKHRSHISRWA